MIKSTDKCDNGWNELDSRMHCEPGCVYLHYGLFGRNWVSLDGSFVSGVSGEFFFFITNVKGTATEPQLQIKWQYKFIRPRNRCNSYIEKYSEGAWPRGHRLHHLLIQCRMGGSDITLLKCLPNVLLHDFLFGK